MSSQLQVSGEAKIRDIQGPVVANSGVITALDGDASQYVRGDGTLADFPTSSGGGSSVSYYLNSSVSQGTIGGVAYRELSKEPIIGAGTDIAISTTGYVASYLTDANDPDVLSIPGGNFNCEFYFSVNNNTGNPFFYAELYKYDGTTFTLLGSSVGVPEYINQGTIIAPYYFAIPVATAALALTDRLAIRIYVNVDGRTVTLHTENGHLCQVVTTLSKGMVSLNNLTDQSQFITTGTSGTDFNIVSSGDTHTFNIPSASASNRGLITTGIQTIAGGKTFSSAITGDSGIALKEGVIPSAVGYTGLAGDADGLLITKRVGSTGYTNLLYFNSATSNTYTFPNLSGTLALLEGTQTFSGLKTFTSDITVNGVKVGKGGGGISTNTVLGTTALNFNTTGDANTALGWNSLQNNTIGASNTGIGAGSLYQNTTGSSNTALGFATLTANTTGTQNVAIGVGSLQNNTTASYNVAIGTGALSANTTGEYNTAIGFYTSNIQTTANNNTSIGFYALKDNTTGSQNTAIGASALSKNTTGFGNTGVGQGALNDNTTGTVNSGFGQGALGNQTTGSGNTGLGYNAGAAITTGSFNIEIGYLNNGSGVVTGSYNTIIGSNITGLSASLANNIVLADGAGNIRYRFDGTTNNFYQSVNLGNNILNAGSINVNPSSGEAQLNLKNTSTGNTIYNGFSSIFGVGGGALGFGLSTGSSTYKSFTFNFAPLTNNTTRIFTFPDASGTLALTSDLGAYVTLATAQTISGNKTFSGINSFTGYTSFTYASTFMNGASLNWTGGSHTAGSLTLSSSHIGSTSSLILSDGDTAKYFYFSFTNTANTNKTYTFPDASGTIALLSGTQTFTGATTFSSSITVSGISVGTAGNGSNIKLGDTNFGVITTGSNNIAIGSSALSSITTSNANIGIGNSALASVVNGAFNIALGFGVGASITSGSNNTLFGYGAGQSITTGNYNTILGAYAGTAGMSSNIVLADGQGNIRYQWNGTNNVFGNPISGTSATFRTDQNAYTWSRIENQANNASAYAGLQLGAFGNTWGIAIGSSSANSNSLNFVIDAGGGNTPRMTLTSGGNVGIGTSNPSAPLQINKDGASEYSALRFSNANSTANFFVGVGGSSVANTSLRNNAYVLNAAATDLILGTSDTERMRITSGGDLTLSNGIIYANGASAGLSTQNRQGANLFIWIAYNAGMRLYNDSLGFIGTFDATTGVYTPNSDNRLKENITDSTNALDTISKIKVKSYDWKNNGLHESYGLIAQEVYEVLPQYVFKPEDENDNWGVSKGEFVPILIKAIQEQQLQIEELKALIAAK
jgi:hypothetical protein